MRHNQLAQANEANSRRRAVQAIMHLKRRIRVPLTRVRVLRLRVTQEHTRSSRSSLLTPCHQRYNRAGVRLLAVILSNSATVLQLATLTSVRVERSLSTTSRALNRNFQHLLRRIRRAISAMTRRRAIFLQFSISVKTIIISNLISG